MQRGLPHSGWGIVTMLCFTIPPSRQTAPPPFTQGRLLGNFASNLNSPTNLNLAHYANKKTQTEFLPTFRPWLYPFPKKFWGFQGDFFKRPLGVSYRQIPIYHSTIRIQNKGLRHIWFAFLPKSLYTQV